MSGQAEFWNERYGGEDFSFGTEPCGFLASQAHRLKPGMRVLVPGDGEGRNGVWLAQQGLGVDTVDASSVGVAKAQGLAKGRGVAIDAQIADLLDWEWPRERYDIVAALYIHFFDTDRPRMHRAMLDALKPGGLIVLEAFRIEQLEYQKSHGSGGPRTADMLCSRAKLEADFAGSAFLLLEEADVGLNDGHRHRAARPSFALWCKSRYDATMKTLKLLVSPAALCIWAICICVSFSIAGSNASRTVTFKQKTKFGYAKAAFPIHMQRWDEALYGRLTTRAKAEMAEFLKGAEQDAAARPQEGEAPAWTPYSQSAGFIEQFRTLRYVSYLEVASIVHGGEQAVTGFRTMNFDKQANRELTLGDFLEGAADRSKALEALAAYARADLRDRTGEQGDEESEALLELTRPDLGTYERFTLCPSTKLGAAAGLTIHFPPATSGPYAGSDFHVTVPYTVFAKFLKPGMKSLFSGEPRQAPVSLEDAGI